MGMIAVPCRTELTRSGIHSISLLSDQIGCEARSETVSVTWGPLWGAQLSSPCGYCCYNQNPYHNMERVTEKRAALPRAPRRGWHGTPFGQLG